MAISRSSVLGSLLVVSIVWQPVSEAAINMPAGAKVWMKFEANPCPDSEGDDCLGSDDAGPNPPNGIPLTTFGSGVGSATGYAEVLPDEIRIYAHSAGSIRVWDSFEDTYTIGGSAAGPFDIPVEFHVTGAAKSVGVNCPSSICNQLVGASSTAKIGTFNTFTDGNFSESLRVSEFNAQAREDVVFPTEGAGAPFTRPIDVTANYTVQGVNVGDSFTLAYGTWASASRGEFDMLSGTVSFDLPPGVELVSALAQSLLPDPGDFNDDDQVDALDYVLWRKSPDDYDGDPDGYNTWSSNFGNSFGTGAANNTAVPEPTSVALVLAAALVILSRPVRPLPLIPSSC